jgi:hypothetical protein
MAQPSEIFDVPVRNGQETSVAAISGGEEDVGVKEEPVHRGRLLGRAVGNGVGIEA